MFQFRRFPTYAYFIQRRLTGYCSAGFPHSEILGSKFMCNSPRLIAACHVLLRLLMPRHSPCALISLTSFKRGWFSKNYAGTNWFIVVCVTLILKSPQIVLCYLSAACSQFLALFHCSVFKVQVPTSFKARLKCSDDCPNTSI